MCEVLARGLLLAEPGDAVGKHPDVAAEAFGDHVEVPLSALAFFPHFGLGGARRDGVGEVLLRRQGWRNLLHAREPTIEIFQRCRAPAVEACPRFLAPISVGVRARPRGRRRFCDRRLSKERSDAASEMSSAKCDVPRALPATSNRHEVRKSAMMQ